MVSAIYSTMNTDFNKGAYGELYVAAELTKAGYKVSFPFESVSPYDAIIETPSGKLIKCQVKTTAFNRINDNTVEFPVMSRVKQKIHSQWGSIYSKKDVDCFLFVDVNTNYVMVFPNPAEQVGARNIIFKYNINASKCVRHILGHPYYSAELFNKKWEYMEMDFDYVVRENDHEIKNVLYGKACEYFRKSDCVSATSLAVCLGMSGATIKKFVEKAMGLCYDEDVKGITGQELKGLFEEWIRKEHEGHLCKQ